MTWKGGTTNETQAWPHEELSLFITSSATDEDGIEGEDAAVPEEKDTTDGGLSVHPLAAVLREEHQLQFVTAGVRIHLRTTSSVIFHRLSDATISDSHNASYVIHCMHCVYL